MPREPLGPIEIGRAGRKAPRRRGATRWAVLPLAFLLLAALALAWRRVSGALWVALGWPVLLPVTLVAASLAAVAHGLLRRWGPRGIYLDLVTCASLMAIATAISLPGTDYTSVVLLWAIVVLEEVWAWRGRAAVASGEQLADASPGQEVQAETVHAETAPDTAPTDPEITQQLACRRCQDGSEELSGWIRVAFRAGERNASVHLAFCPPLPHAPGVTVEQRAGAPARTKVGRTMPYGVRLDVRLQHAARVACEVLLGVLVRCEALPPAAAPTTSWCSPNEP